jgi:hypothetical protein
MDPLDSLGLQAHYEIVVRSKKQSSGERIIAKGGMPIENVHMQGGYLRTPPAVAES